MRSPSEPWAAQSRQGRAHRLAIGPGHPFFGGTARVLRRTNVWRETVHVQTAMPFTVVWRCVGVSVPLARFFARECTCCLV